MFVNTGPTGFDTVYLEQAGSLWKLRIGEQTLGFATDQAAQASVDLKGGAVQLSDARGVPVNRVPLPDLQALLQEAARLNIDSVAIRADQVPDFLRWLTTQSLRESDLRLFLAQLQTMVPSEAAQQSRQISVQAALSSHFLGIEPAQMSRILGLMPQEMVQMTLDYSLEIAGGSVEQLGHLLGRIDAQKDLDIVQFLAGRKPLQTVLPHLEELVQRNQVLIQQSPSSLDPNSLQALLKWTAKQEIEPALGSTLPAQMRQTLLETGILSLPNFSLFDSLEEMELEWQAQTMKKLFTGKQLAFDRRLIQGLTREQFPQLHHFLTNRGITWQNSHLLEGHHLIALPHDKLGAMNHLPRIVPHQRNVASFRLSAHLDKLTVSQPDATNVSAKFDLLRPIEKTGFWVLDHLTNEETPQLKRYFNAKIPVEVFTDGLKNEIQTLFETRHLPPSRPDLKAALKDPRFAERFETLLNALRSNPKLPAMLRYRPLSPIVEKLFERLFPERPQPEPQSSINQKWRAAFGDKLPKRITDGIEAVLKSILPKAEREELITGLLKRKFPQFKSLRLFNALLHLKSATNSPEGPPIQTALTWVKTAVSGSPGPSGPWILDSQQIRSVIPQINADSRSPGPIYEQLRQVLPEWPKSFSDRLQLMEYLSQAVELTNQVPQSETARATVQNWTEELFRFLLREPAGNWTRPSNQVVQQSQATPISHLGDLLEGTLEQLGEGLEQLKKKGISGAALKELKDLHLKLEQMRSLKQDPESWLRNLIQTVDRGETIAQLPEKLGRLLERMHDWNRFQNLNQAPLFFSIPVSIQEEQRQLEILYKPLRRKGKDCQFLVVLHLDFERFGHLRTDILKRGKDLAVSFWTSTAAMKGRIENHLPWLRDQIAEQGLAVTELTVKHAKERAQKKPHELVVSYHEGTLDTKA